MIYNRESALMPSRINSCNVLKGHDMENASECQAESPAIIDCGVASQETKGYPFGLFFEFVSPPFDKQFPA
jgi:hypothetical protein